MEVRPAIRMVPLLPASHILESSTSPPAGSVVLPGPCSFSSDDFPASAFMAAVSSVSPWQPLRAGPRLLPVLRGPAAASVPLGPGRAWPRLPGGDAGLGYSFIAAALKGPFAVRQRLALPSWWELH